MKGRYGQKALTMATPEKRLLTRVRTDGFFDPSTVTVAKVRRSAEAMCKRLVRDGLLRVSQDCDGVYEMTEAGEAALKRMKG